ncbi:MAG: type II toxin-antitoxin system prevent-host-death family antitoxin [Chloroflexi bacterium]|nr:type II toxin-antitoxin system prevent-host-death family antitoxin [Chloroflexota bacterium]
MAMKTIPQRELRNQIAQVLRQVEAGERLRVTVDGRPVADLVPIGGARRTFVPREEVARLLERAPLDPAFGHEMAAAMGASVDEL